MQLTNDNLTFDSDYAAIPERMQGALVAYVRNGRLPGTFLQAVLSNNLYNATGHADSTNLPLIPLYVLWLFNRARDIAPECYGSPAAVAAWVAKGGLEGERA